MWLNLQFSADLVVFTEEIIDGKLHLLCSEMDKGEVHYERFPENATKLFEQQFLGTLINCYFYCMTLIWRIQLNGK